jgi:adenylate kinase
MNIGNQKKQVIILLGPPGSGKGTQGTLLAEKLGLYYFETSKILEESFNGHREGEFVEIGGEKFYFAKEKENWENGLLVSPAFVVYLSEGKIRNLHKEEKGIVFSGALRTMPEAEKLMSLVKELYGERNINIILLEINAENSVFRNSNRRICELMRHPILYSEETKNLNNCPIDGSKLIKRELDNPETIKIRLKEYEERTLPIVEYFNRENLRVKKINGEQSVADVYGDILKVLE